MSDKSVLVIDTPSMCRECRLFDRDYVWCVPLNDATVNDDILDNCPLKPLPHRDNSNKLIEEYKIEKECSPYSYLVGYEIGWNSCLDEITGETE